MNLAEWMTRQAIAADVKAALDLNGHAVCEPLSVAGWVLTGGVADAGVVFGPFPEKTSATGVRLMIDTAVTVQPFDSLLTFPAGQTFRVDVTIGVEG